MRTLKCGGGEGGGEEGCEGGKVQRRTHEDALSRNDDIAIHPTE